MKYAEMCAFDMACREVMRRIEDGGYVAALKPEGIGTIHKFGIVCYQKSCRVMYRLE